MTAVVNFSLIAFFLGLVVAGLITLCNRLSSVGKEDSDKLKRKLERLERKKEGEAVSASDSAFSYGGKRP